MLVSQPLYAIPFFARKYNKSCTECHAGYPKLNFAGELIKRNLYLPENYNPRMQTMELMGDKKIYLQRDLPISGRIKVFLGALSDSSGLKPSASANATIYASTNLSGNSAFFAALNPSGIRDAFINIRLPFESRILLGKFDFSELFIKRYDRITYQDFLVYDFAGLKGTGGYISFTRFIQSGFLDLDSVKVFLRAGADTKNFSFGVFAVPKDSAQRYGSDIRFRFGPLDMFSTLIFCFNQNLGSFEMKDTTFFISGHAGVDVVISYGFFISILYNYIGTFYKEYQTRYHTNMITLAFGHYPLRNLKASVEIGYNMAARFPAYGTYGGVVLDWSF